MSALPLFCSALAKQLADRHVTVSAWNVGGRRSANLVQLRTSRKPTVLYVKEFNVPNKPGFWGLTRNQLTRLEAADVRWFAVLLLRSAGAGYVLTGTQVLNRISNGSFELSGDGDYKVNEDKDLAPAQFFDRVSQLIDRVL